MSARKPGLLVSVICSLLLFAPGVSAQISPVVPGTITVNGEGSASAPAESASVVITIGADSNIYYEDSMNIEEVANEPTSIETVDVSKVVDAIVEFGIPVNDVSVVETPFMGEWGAGMGLQPATIVVTVVDPVVDELSGLLEVVRTASHEEGLFVNQFGVMYSVADCRAVRQEARVNAFAESQFAAEDQAAAMNTTLGNPVASRDTFPMNMGYFMPNNCNSSTAATPYSLTYMVGQFDPTLPAEVRVFVAVEVTYEIP